MPLAPDITIRPATVRDVPAMAEIINGCAELGLMLHRSLSYLYEHIRDFQVAAQSGEANRDGESDEGNAASEQVIGVCGLNIIWADMAEVYALAVRPSARGKGVGKAMVRACMDEAHTLGVRRQMALTYEQRFFEALGYVVVDRQTLPLKVWSQCVRCAKHQACDEIAVVHTFPDLPAPKTPTAPTASKPAAATLPGGVLPPEPVPAYEVPVPLTVRRSLPPGTPRPKMDEMPGQPGQGKTSH